MKLTREIIYDSDNLKKSKKEWKEYEVELNNQIEEIKEKNDFKDSDLNVREVNGRAKLLDKDDARNLIKKPAKEIDINKRLVITKTVMNDTRRVKPRNESEEKGMIIKYAVNSLLPVPFFPTSGFRKTAPKVSSKSVHWSRRR